MRNVVAVIQARMGSTRLPRKIMEDVEGQPMLMRVVERTRRASRVRRVLVATTTEPSDDAVEAWCRAANVDVYRGSENDVLDRYYRAARAADADVVVRITADCPLPDPLVIDHIIGAFCEGGADYASNTLERTYPDGIDVEVFSFDSLSRAWEEASLQSEREHVTPYIWKNPQRFRLRSIVHDKDLSNLRLTVDEPEDLEVIRHVYRHFGQSVFSLADVVGFLRDHPEVAKLNARFGTNEGYEKSLREDAVVDRPGKGQRLYVHAKQRIPGGTQLLSKRPEMFLPGQWPSYFQAARGVEVWDLDGNRYVDMSYNGIGACILGAADPDVDAAVMDAVSAGVASTLNCAEEVELADLLCELHPWASMVRYTRSGGEAMSVAVRIARAATRRDKVAVCGYHGWHDWYLAANLSRNSELDGHLLPGLNPLGVPRGLVGTTLPFRYNAIEELREIVAKNASDLAAIVMEPVRDQEPAAGFLDQVRQIADETRAILIIDEITAGFRLTTGGAHLAYGLVPDIAVFAKGMSNGYAMAAVIGKESVMQAAQATFISSTNWTERIGPVAALATIRKHGRHNVAKHLIEMGTAVEHVWHTAAAEAGLALTVGGMKPLIHFAFEAEDGRAAHTLFTKLMLQRGYLATKSFYATYAHQPEHVASYAHAVSDAFAAIAEARRRGSLTEEIDGEPAHTGFHRLT